MDNNTCVYCFEQNEVKLPTGKSKLNKSKVYRYESIDSFGFYPKLWEKVISFGFNPLHKLIRCSENLAKMSEHKFAEKYLPQVYRTPKSKQAALSEARNHFRKQFRLKLGLKYFVADPRNGGNSNTGPVMRKMFDNPAVTSSIFEISPQTVYSLGKCLSMVNRTSSVSSFVYEKFSRDAFNGLMCDLGNYGFLSGNMHALLCHGKQAIEHSQTKWGIPLGALSENSVEMGNKQNLLYRKIFSRKCDLKKENSDIFRRRLLVSDPFFILNGLHKQIWRKGNIRKTRK